jgi:hypothetical protein
VSDTGDLVNIKRLHRCEDLRFLEQQIRRVAELGIPIPDHVIEAANKLARDIKALQPEGVL